MYSMHLKCALAYCMMFWLVHRAGGWEKQKLRGSSTSPTSPQGHDRTQNELKVSYRVLYCHIYTCNMTFRLVQAVTMTMRWCHIFGRSVWTCDLRRVSMDSTMAVQHAIVACKDKRQYSVGSVDIGPRATCRRWSQLYTIALQAGHRWMQTATCMTR